MSALGIAVKVAPPVPRTRGFSAHKHSNPRPPQTPPRRFRRNGDTSDVGRSSPAHQRGTISDEDDEKDRPMHSRTSISGPPRMPHRCESINFVEENSLIAISNTDTISFRTEPSIISAMRLRRKSHDSIQFDVRDITPARMVAPERSDIVFEIESITEATHFEPKTEPVQGSAVELSEETGTHGAPSGIRGASPSGADENEEEQPRPRRKAPFPISGGRPPARAKTTPRREVPQKSRSEVMNERPWRTSTPRRNGSCHSAHRPSAVTTPTRRISSTKTRQELMSERPWRAGMRTRERTAVDVSLARKVLPVAPLVSPRSPSTRRGVTDGITKSVTDGMTSGVTDGDGLRTPTDSSAETTPRTEKGATVPVPVEAAAVALRGPPGAVLVDELQRWVELANAQAALRDLLAVMRVREAEVRRGATRLEALARKAKRVDGELAALQRRPVDRMGSSPRRPYQRETSRGSLASRSSSQIPASRSCVSPRLYQTPRHAATTYHYLSKRPARALSVLSDDDLPEKDLKEHANELMQWREERSQLLSEKVRMVQQHKELNFHLRRGTHIKPISAVTPTSARTPIKQLALKSFSAVDADGHNLLARLRLDANRVGIEVTKCRAAHQEAISRVARTRESLESNLEDLKMKRDQWRIRFESVACKMEETIACAKSISAQLVSIRSSDQKYKGIVADRLGIKREDAEGVPGLLSLRNRIEGGKLLVMHTNKVESVLNAALERLRGIYPAPI